MPEPMPLLVQCARRGCGAYFAPAKGKLYCKPACRAQASIEARYIRKPIKRRPTTSKAWLMAAEWLRGRMV